MVAKEDLMSEHNLIAIGSSVKEGQHVRHKGSDIEKGESLFRVGTQVDIGAQALIASLGIATVSTYSIQKVAVLSTGDELVHYSKAPKWGQIRNTNNLMLCNLLRSMGIQATDLGTVRDNLPDTVAAIKDALKHDVIISTGGVSVGEFDFVKQALTEANIQLEFWKVAMKPGKPVVYGSHESGTHFFGLPGNPGSAFVAFSLFLRPFLKKLMGSTSPQDWTINGFLSEEYKKKSRRAHFLRANVTMDSEQPIFNISRPQGSGSLLSICDVDALVKIPAETLVIDMKTKVEAILLK